VSKGAVLNLRQSGRAAATTGLSVRLARPRLLQLPLVNAYYSRMFALKGVLP
jgi:hypothetical protein